MFRALRVTQLRPYCPAVRYMSHASTIQRCTLSRAITSIQMMKPLPFKTIPRLQITRLLTSQAPQKEPLTKKEQLKKAFKDYGSTVIVFHIGISLISLGGFYLLVSSGLDVFALVEKLGFSADSIGKLGANASTFVVAYAIHKVFAPVRISITLFSTPFIVRYLRGRGILKPPKF